MPKTIPAPTETLPDPDLAERRYVYNGEKRTDSHEYASRGNRPVKRRRQSPFSMIAIVICVSLLIVFYVWNKITVNQLVVEINDLQNQHEKILAANEIMLAEINKKSTMERIGKIAGEKLQMTPPKEQPRQFTVDPDQLEKAGEYSSQ